MRQWIAAIFDTLKGQLSLEEHSGRTLPGVYAHVASSLLAMATHDLETDAPAKRFMIAYEEVRPSMQDLMLACPA